MTVLNENRENLRKPLAAHIDYRQFLNPQIQGMNVDLVIERRGDFLVVEFKGPGETETLGEAIMLRRLAGKPGFEVLVYEYGENREGTLYKTMDLDTRAFIVATGLQGLNDYILAWARKRGLPW